jgi:hypothetical protein
MTLREARETRQLGSVPRRSQDERAARHKTGIIAAPQL